METHDEGNNRLLLDARYTVKEEELVAALRCAAHKTEGRRLTVQVLILSLISAVYLALFALNPARLYAFFLSGLCLLLVLGLLYLRPWRRRRKARRMLRQGREARVRVFAGGTFEEPGGEALRLGRDKAEAYETEELFVLRFQNGRLFCLPKRALGPEGQAALRRLLENKNTRPLYCIL